MYDCRYRLLPIYLVLAAALAMSPAALLSAADSPPRVVRSTQSGAWSDHATWEGGVLPAAGDRVLIRTGHEVLYNVDSDQTIRLLRIAGTLRFARDRDTRLDVGLIRIEAGEDLSETGFDCAAHDMPAAPGMARPAFEVGSPTAPIDPRFRALIRLVYQDGMDKQTCPAIVNCGGRMDFHGAPMSRTWLKLDGTVTAGATELKLSEVPTGWRPGQRILIPTTAKLFLLAQGGKYDTVLTTVRVNSQSEERTIRAIDGAKIQLDEPLIFRHHRDGEFRGEVANLSRNVIVESADPAGVRGHTMYHAGSTGAISYAEFRHLGKRGVLGKYSLHFHLCRDTMRGSYVIGASIHDSDNRWLTIHGTDYLIVRDCVGYNSLGHGFFLEDGTEVFNVFDRNLAVQALHAAPLPEQMLPYDENEGAGFWWANCLNTFTRNVAAECDQYGYRFEAEQTATFSPVLSVPQPDGTRESVDIRTLPFVRFADNEAHSQRRFAFNLGGIRHISDAEDHKTVHTPGADLSRIQGGHVDGVGPDTQHPYVIRNFRVWRSHWVFHGGSPNVLIDGLKAVDCTYGIFKTRIEGHEYRNLDMQRIETAMIFQPWGSSSVAENYRHYLDATDDLPPATVITHYEPVDETNYRVRGTTTDNGKLKGVTVNGQPAKFLPDSDSQWEAIVEVPSGGGNFEFCAAADDKAGNAEARPHLLLIAK